MGLTNSEKESKTLNASVFTVVWLFIFILCSTLHSLQVKKIIGNVTVKNHLKESLLSILSFIIQEVLQKRV